MLVNLEGGHPLHFCKAQHFLSRSSFRPRNVRRLGKPCLAASFLASSMVSFENALESDESNVSSPPDILWLTQGGGGKSKNRKWVRRN